MPSHVLCFDIRTPAISVASHLFTVKVEYFENVTGGRGGPGVELLLVLGKGEEGRCWQTKVISNMIWNPRAAKNRTMGNESQLWS